MKKIVLGLAVVAAIGVAGCTKHDDTANNTADINATAVEAGNDVNAAATDANASTGNVVTTTGNTVDATGNAVDTGTAATTNAAH
ncbi:MAG TPA: hypothetical protein VH331_16070 [Allosphingosinicella sp.]|jgi:outer membrane murein-binding lipoprotein Lpp|nr:hypothetical protein [Allosphingosinicella sp.]